MGQALRQRLKQQTPFNSPADEAMLNILITADYLRTRFELMLSDYGITQSQYNILRILRGVHPEGHSRGEIAARMIERAPDCTRLIDGLQRKRLVERTRTPNDRRLSLTRITQAGLDLLSALEPRVLQQQQEILKRISLEECLALSYICEKLYCDTLPPSSC
jgi:DNA-binding MarR family transcriptional regulator